MNEFVEVTGTEAQALARFLGIEDAAHVHTLRFAVDGGIKIKVNEYMWSPPFGDVVTTS